MYLAVYYLLLDDITINEKYPLSWMYEYFGLLVEAKWFTTFDIDFGSWQVEIPEKDQSKTTLLCLSGCSKFKCIPYGFCNTPVTFQRVMDIYLSQLNWQICVVYLDDFFLVQQLVREVQKDVPDILTFLQCFVVSLKDNKCAIFKHSIDCGEYNNPGKLEISENTVKYVCGFRKPHTQNPSRLFLSFLK